MKRRRGPGPGPGPGHSAPYGHACLSCFKSKCKCVARPDGEGCQRCHRLKKPCHPSDSLRQHAATAKRKSNTRIAELEDKVNTLLSLLQSHTALSDDTAQLLGTQVGGLDTVGNEDAIHSWAAYSPERLGASPTTSEPSANDVEMNLGVFRSRMLCHFAFMHLPAGLTAQELRRDRPLLFRAIIAVTSRSADEKRAQGKKLKRVLCETAPSMDLLQGLLTYIAWGWDHVLNRCSLFRLMMLAISLVGEMRLNKPIAEDEYTMAYFSPGSESWHTNGSSLRVEVFLERHRAVLGCFLISSIISSCFSQVDALRWTPEMEESLTAISTNKECPTDVILALQVRMQLLAEKAAQICNQQQVDQAKTGTTAIPAFLSLTILQEQLQELRESFSPDLRLEKSLMAHTSYIELCISKAALAVHLIVPPVTRLFDIIANGHAIGNGTAGTVSPAVERLLCLWQSVRAIETCTSAFMALSLPDFLGISFLQWAELTDCVVSLAHLMEIEHPGWDRVTVRAVVDMPVLQDRIARRLDEAAREAGEQGPDEVFMQLAQMMWNFRPGVNHRTTEETAWSHSQTYVEAAEAAAAALSKAPTGDYNEPTQLYDRPILAGTHFGHRRDVFS